MTKHIRKRIRRDVDPPPFELRDLVQYAPDTGDLLWTVSRGRGVAGDRAGTRYPGDVSRLRYLGQHYPCDMLAWWLVTGDWMEAYRYKWADGDRENNRAANLTRWHPVHGRQVLGDVLAKMPRLPTVTALVAKRDNPGIAWHSIRQGDLLDLLGDLVDGLTVDEIAGYWRDRHGATSNSYVLRALRGLEKRRAVRVVGGRVYRGIPDYLK